MGETPLVDRRARAPLRLEHAVLVEPCAYEVPVDIARDHEGVSVLCKTPQPVHERAGLIFEIFLLMKPLGPSASHAASGEASPCSMQPMPSVWARSPYASRKWVSAQKRLSPSAMSSPLLAPMMTRSASASAGRCEPPSSSPCATSPASCARRRARRDVGANGEPPIFDRAGEKLRLVVHGDVAACGNCAVRAQNGSWINAGVMRPTPSSRKRILCRACASSQSDTLRYCSS